MLLQNGMLGDTRILSRKTVELMTSDFLTPEQRKMPFFYDTDFWAGQGYGLGVSVVDKIAKRGEPSSVGQYGWNGAYGTLWLNDPKEKMTAILMIQTAYGETAPRIQRDFRTLVYQAMND
jgi:CubicO group peptidase (beta-lactamase class C family)